MQTRVIMSEDKEYIVQGKEHAPDWGYDWVFLRKYRDRAAAITYARLKSQPYIPEVIWKSNE